MNQESSFHLQAGEGGCEQREFLERRWRAPTRAAGVGAGGGGRRKLRNGGGRRNEVGEMHHTLGIFRVPRSCWIRLGAKKHSPSFL